MPFNKDNRGDPFRGDFPRRDSQGEWDEFGALEQRQLVELTRLRHEPARRHEMLGLLQSRRVGATDQSITQFDYLPVETGFDTLMARGELLITASSYDGRSGPGSDQTAKAYLDSIGMQASEADCADLRGRVLRLTHPSLGPQELSEVARTLRSRGHTASLSYMVPTAPVSKGPARPVPPPAGTFTPAAASAGTPARVAVIDTGIADQARTDGWLANVPRGNNIDPLDAFPPPSGDGYLDFDAGHGTFVAGIVQQIAPGAELRVYRAVASDGIASEVRVACEMIRAVRDGADIINLSLGCQTQDNIPPLAIDCALQIIGELETEQDREVLIVAAAGNYADTTPCWPAAFRRVVSVAALAPDMRPSPWSTSGSWVTCATIGQGVPSVYVDGAESPQVAAHPYQFSGNSWALWSGTSFSAPQITGAIARLRQENGYSLRVALTTLLSAGYPEPGFGQALKILPGI
jgi:hypothetical protein